jgi:hypothetical protein
MNATNYLGYPNAVDTGLHSDFQRLHRLIYCVSNLIRKKSFLPSKLEALI